MPKPYASVEQLKALELFARRQIVRKSQPANAVWLKLFHHRFLAAYPRPERAAIASAIIYSGAGLEIML
jgi:hypothetical protein